MAETTFLLLFRGVGGATQLPVAPLREALTRAGFRQATTWINSGNALVRSTLSREKTRAKVAQLCQGEFGFDKPIFLPTAAEWQALIDHDPFPAAAAGNHVHAVLLAEVPDPAAVRALQALAEGDEALVLADGDAAQFGPYAVCYLYTPHGFGTSKLAARFDKGIGVVNTARNRNTVLKLAALARGIDGK